MKDPTAERLSHLGPDDMRLADQRRPAERRDGPGAGDEGCEEPRTAAIPGGPDPHKVRRPGSVL